jgi:hypothetical protein
MNCLESRRALLAEPRRRDSALDAHLASCEACHRVADALGSLDRDITDAASVRTPDGLAARILLARGTRPIRRYAVAAAIVIASGLGVLMAAQLVDFPFTSTADVVGPAHPAVAAISEVTEDAMPPASESEGSFEVDQVLKRLGLTLKTREATTQYVGKCHVTAGECDRIVLSTRDAQANVMLMPEYRFDARMLVTDRRMIALVNPSGAGGYIVVADTPKIARRIEKLLVKG